MYDNKTTTLEERSRPIPEVTLFIVCFGIYWMPILAYWFVALLGINLNLIGYGILEIIAAIVFIRMIRKETDRPSRKELGIKASNPEWMILLGVLLAGFSFLMYQLYFGFLSIFRIDFGDYEIELTPEIIVWIVLIAPFWEELIYRVGALTLLARRYTAMKASFMVAVWFIAKHFLQRHENGASWESVVLVIFFEIFAWTMVNYLFLKYRSLLIPLAYHVCWNASAVIGRGASAGIQDIFFILLMLAGIMFVGTAFLFFGFLDGKEGRNGKRFDSFFEPFSTFLTRLRDMFRKEDLESISIMAFFIILLTLFTEPLQIVMQSNEMIFLMGLFVLLAFTALILGYYMPANYFDEKNVPASRLFELKPVYYTKDEYGEYAPHFQYAMNSVEGRNGFLHLPPMAADVTGTRKAGENVGDEPERHLSEEDTRENIGRITSTRSARENGRHERSGRRRS